jgi:hypothetical protein
MPPVVQNNKWDIAKLSLAIAFFGLVYNMYKDLGSKMDTVIRLEQRLTDHETSDNVIHTQLFTQIAEVRSKIETTTVRQR